VYKLLLCWRYLRTRYLALVCIVSVMLGVATLIVVNSVMGGFSSKLRERLHGLLSDVVVESWDHDGFPRPEAKMALIRSDPWLGERVEAMSATMEIFAIVQFSYKGMPITRAVRLIGVEPGSRSRLGGFAEYVVDGQGRPGPATFELPDEAVRRQAFLHPPDLPAITNWALDPPRPGERPPPEPPQSKPFVPRGVIVGHAIAHFLRPRVGDQPPEEVCTLNPGDDVTISTITGGPEIRPVQTRFAVCGYFRSEMSEYDASYVFVPLDYLQSLRGLDDHATSIQIRLKDYPRDSKKAVERLRFLFTGAPVQVSTWEDKQGPLLAAIGVEKGILNVLLFLIIAVAGFGILAIFSMIVVEKTRDIGILKALGASNGGVLKIFLSYGLLLGVVGAAVGTALGLAITIWINEIERVLARVTGQELFPRDVYYFKDIPTDVQPLSVGLIVLGAVGIAVVFSILPALRAALLHPVRALRYE
jgi:lipoprotein-releasing system permease protein